MEKRKTVHEIRTEGYRAGLHDAMFRAARIADGHRAMHLDSGRTMEAMAVSAVAAFIVQSAREWGAWNNDLQLPLVKSKGESDDK